MAHRITNHDLWSLKSLGNIALSSDGRRIAFVTQSSDKEKDRSRSAISLLYLDEQYVVTLSGVLLFENREGKTQRIEPGDVLLAEDLTGGGHRWRLIDDQPWRRLYITLPD